MSPPVTCDFCKTPGEDEITGEMQRTPDGRIVAHYNCMLYSPQVFQIDSEEEEGFEFDIESVQSEIERGQKLRCNICRKAGATAGCDDSSCPKTYHYPCVQKAQGSSSPNRYVVYCKDHKSKNTANGSKDTDGKTKKRASRSSANQTAIWEDCPEVGDGWKQRIVTRTSGKYIGHKDKYYLSPEGEKFRSKKELQIHMDESMDPSPSKSKDRRTQSPAEKNNGTRAGDAVSGRTDVNVTDKATGSNNSEIEKTPETEIHMNVRVNLQKLPAEEHYTSEQPASPQGAPPTQLNAVAQMSSQQHEDSRRCSVKAVSKRKHRTCGNCSEPLPDDYEGILCRDCLQEESGSIWKFTDQRTSHDVPPKKRPYILQDQDVTDLPASIDSLDDSEVEEEGDGGNSDASQIDHPTAVTPSAGSTYSPQATPDQTSEPATSSMVPISAQAETCNGHDVAAAPGPNNYSQVLQNDNMAAEDALDSDVTNNSLCSGSPDIDKTPARRSPEENHFIEEQPDRLQDEETPDRMSAHFPKRRKMTNEIFKLIRTQSSGSTTEDTSCRSTLDASSCSANFPQSRSVAPPLGTLSELLRSHIPEIQSAVETSKRKTAKNAEYSKDDTQNQLHAAPQRQSNIESGILSPGTSKGQATSEGSPNPNTKDPPADSYLREPLEIQKGSGIPNEKINLGCQERSESITSRRNIFPELLPNRNLQQTEGNLNENLEIPEELAESNLEETALVEVPITPGSVASECVQEHQSGPSRMVTPYRRRLCRSLHRSKSQTSFQRVDLDDLDGFGSAVAGQCQRMPQDRQTKYMSYVLASADLFCTHPIVPELDILITNLRTLLERSQQSTPFSGCGSSG